MMLAQATTEVPWLYVGGIFIALCALAAGINQVDDFFERRKTKLPPPQTPPNEQLEASRRDLDRRVTIMESNMVGGEWFKKVDADLAEIKADLKKDRDDNEKHISARASKIYAEMKTSNELLQQQIKDEGERRVIQIDDVRKELSENLESVRQELSDNQRALPNEIVTLLKNTGAI